MRLFRLVVAAFGMAVLACAAGAQEPHSFTLAAADLRPAQSLDGEWSWSIDPYRDGVATYHGAEAEPGHRRYEPIDTTEAMRRDPAALYEYDLDRSATVRLPQSFITHSPEMRHYSGLVWYQRRFTAHPQAGHRAFLRFGAVDYHAYIYLNGKRLGEHVGGFTPCTLEVTALRRDGGDRLTVGADSERGPEDVPPPVTDWENYGGITRPVSLIFTPSTFVDDAWLRLTREGRIAARVKLDGPNAAGRMVRIRIPVLGFVMEGRSGADGSWNGSATAPDSLVRWSPERPTLYEAEVDAGEDHWRDRIGFRTIEVRGADILLNGRPIFLKGINIHAEELGSDPTRNITDVAARALLNEAKQGLHANFVRLAHYPHPETMVRAADELGLLVWSEIPVYWQVDFGNAATLDTARRMQSESILRDRNRASIILWSVGNETPLSDQRNRFLTALIANARSLDGTRLVTAALQSKGEAKTQTIDDPVAADLDVISVNTYAGWYSPDPLKSLPEIRWRSSYGKPLIFSEFGADAKAGYHDDPANPHKFSEEFQAEYYRQTLAMAAKVPMLRGVAPWILKDFRSPRRQHPIYQQGWNRKGLISETGVHKKAFDVLAEHYRSLDPPR